MAKLGTFPSTSITQGRSQYFFVHSVAVLHNLQPTKQPHPLG